MTKPFAALILLVNIVTAETLVGDTCRWSQCLPGSSAPNFCIQLNAVLTRKKPCSNGFMYKCCSKDINCIWSKCSRNASELACPMQSVKKDAVDCGNDKKATACCRKQSEHRRFGLNDVPETSYKALVKNLVLENNDFTQRPKFLPCIEIDPEKLLTLKTDKNEIIPVCDFCSNFPQKSLKNVYLNRPAKISEKIPNYGGCFFRCYTEKTCMALSYNHDSQICNLFDSTSARYEVGKGWSSVLMTQPTGIIHDWAFTRHTQFIGLTTSPSVQISFLHCLNECDQTEGCNLVNYQFKTKRCILFGDLKNITHVNYVYGDVSAIRLGLLTTPRSSDARFMLEGDKLQLPQLMPSTAPICQSLRNRTHGGYPSEECLKTTIAKEGCDLISGCRICYYPEENVESLHLPICPDSRFTQEPVIEAKIFKKMDECVLLESCIGVGYDRKNGDVDVMNINDYVKTHYETRYMLKIPPDPARHYLGKYDLVPYADIHPSSRHYTEQKNVDFPGCVDAFSKKRKATRMAYSFTSRLCKLGSDVSAYSIDINDESIVLLKKPSLILEDLTYVKKPGFRIIDIPREQHQDCPGHCSEKCSKLCSEDYKDWCGYISMTEDNSGFKCHFYSAGFKALYENDPKSTVLVKTSALNFSLDSLDKLSAFQTPDLLHCVEKTDPQAYKNENNFINWSDFTKDVLKYVINMGNSINSTGTDSKFDTALHIIKHMPIVGFGLKNSTKHVIRKKLRLEILEKDVFEKLSSILYKPYVHQPAAMLMNKNLCEKSKDVFFKAGVNSNQRKTDTDDAGKQFCMKPEGSNVMIRSLSGHCDLAKPGQECRYECEPGYTEGTVPAVCKKEGDRLEWSPPMQCILKKCPKGNNPVIVLETPQLESDGFPSFDGQRTAFVVFFNKTRKLPIWTATLHQEQQSDTNQLNSFQRIGESFMVYPCKELETHQTTNEDYAGITWYKAQLTPAKAMDWSHKARELSFLYLNTAPQDGFTHSGPWAFLESHINCFSKTHLTVVATGVCEASLERQSKTIEIPTCFWKMVCYVDEEGNHQVVGFYAGNSLTNTEEEKHIRKNETLTPLSQQELSIKIEGSFKDVWSKSMKYLSAGRRMPYDWLPTNILQCETARDLNKQERNAWATALNQINQSTNSHKIQKTNKSSISRGCFSTVEKITPDVEGDYDAEDLILRDGLPDVSVQKCGKRIIGYYSYKDGRDLTGNDFLKVTHIIYSFLRVFPNGTISVEAPVRSSLTRSSDSVLLRERLEKLMKIGQSNRHVKIMFAVGGPDNMKELNLIAQFPDTRVAFMASVVEILLDWGFDGVDIHWLHPKQANNRTNSPERSNFLILMKELRTVLSALSDRLGTKEKFQISFPGPLSEEELKAGYDLPGLLTYADFVNIMTFGDPTHDVYNGTAQSIFCNTTNNEIHAKLSDILNFYICETKLPHKISIGVSFYRTTHVSDSRSKYTSLRNRRGRFRWQKPPVDIPFENDDLLHKIIDLAVEKNVGGLTVWGMNFDDTKQTRLSLISEADLCKITDPSIINYKCLPVEEKRWWTLEDGADKVGLCGRSAPLYNGYYPICNPHDPARGCCGKNGRCGSGAEYCNCRTCKNYFANPSLMLEDPVKPTFPVRWFFTNETQGKRFRCGRRAPKLDTYYATCNPEDENMHCCSNYGYCGTSKEHCDCKTCVNFKNNPNFLYSNNLWWSLREDGKELAYLCGPKAPKIGGTIAPQCNPKEKRHCCNSKGRCGCKRQDCNCNGCVDYSGHKFKSNPNHWLMQMMEYMNS